ncbi:MAG TPA: hypothetical protein VFG35_03565 [Actinoplanes sp.]|nr:hypothetical protein [Actinoplanes sp.]
MSDIPWWGIPLIAAVFALAGAASVQLTSARNDYLRSRRRRTRRWYEERTTAYVALLAVFERDFYRLRAASDAGEKPVPALVYLDEVAPALMQVRLLASGAVRSGALAVHVLLQKLHGEMNPAAVVGVEPQIHFSELLIQVPLVMQQFEAAIREELRIEPTPPTQTTVADADARGRAWSRLRRPARVAPLDGHADIRQDLSRDR